MMDLSVPNITEHLTYSLCEDEGPPYFNMSTSFSGVEDLSTASDIELYLNVPFTHEQPQKRSRVELFPSEIKIGEAAFEVQGEQSTDLEMSPKFSINGIEDLTSGDGIANDVGEVAANDDGEVTANDVLDEVITNDDAGEGTAKDDFGGMTAKNSLTLIIGHMSDFSIIRTR
uniref:Uncharacterized protein LOC111107313 n=1 Tax=Crassostrea virginica TaxID=6565 RepID=A0A8B8B631_CRAVI|nr:uncharacterized protein LOC111107313 [Crassostrea virginica]